jgi:putative transposase
LTAAQKRQVVRELRQQGLCLRLGLKLVQMARATFYRQGRGRPEEQRLQERIRELALSQASFGYRRITAVLRRQGLRVNPKRVDRLYRQLDLQKPVRKKGRRGLKRPVSFAPSEALFAGQVRAVDFIEDKLVSGRRLRILTVLDICSRYGLGSRVEHSITGALAARHLEGLFRRYGAPRVLRRDQGASYLSRPRKARSPGNQKQNFHLWRLWKAAASKALASSRVRATCGKGLD